MYKCRQGKARTQYGNERHKCKQRKTQRETRNGAAQRERQTSKGTKAINERIHKGGEVNAQRQAGSATKLGKERRKRRQANVKSQAIKHPFCG